MTGPNFEPTTPPLDKIEGAYLELIGHNTEHTGMGNAMAGLLLGLLEQQDDPIKEVEGSTIEPSVHSVDPNSTGIEPSAVVKGELSEDLLSLTVDPVFEAVGLARITAGQTMAGDKPVVSGEQELMIVQPTKFVDLLERSKGQLSKHPDLQRMVENSYRKLLTVISVLSQPQGEVLTKDQLEAQRVSLDMLERVYPHVSKLVETDGLKVNLEPSTAYLNWGKRPEFSDYIEARNLGLRETNSFSAAEWHLDASPNSYSEYWGQLFAHYDDVVSKWGKDSDLAVLMRGQISDVAEQIQVWLEKGGYEELPTYTEALRPEIQKVLARVAALNG